MVWKVGMLSFLLFIQGIIHSARVKCEDGLLSWCLAERLAGQIGPALEHVTTAACKAVLVSTLRDS